MVVVYCDSCKKEVRKPSQGVNYVSIVGLDVCIPCRDDLVRQTGKEMHKSHILGRPIVPESCVCDRGRSQIKHVHSRRQVGLDEFDVQVIPEVWICVSVKL